VYVMIEAAVGGGIPVITPLKQALSVNRLQAVMGIINGTTNYILTRMQNEGGDFGAILADAQQLGYAEADPTADVDGLDAADKIAILAALAFGGRINRDDVYCEGIRNVSAADITYAKNLGFVIKLLAIAKLSDDSNPDRIQVRVHPTLVPVRHPLASVNGVNNAVLVEGDPIGQIMLYGPGAGEGPTASAVVSDLLQIAANATRTTPNPLLSCSHSHTLSIVPNAEVVTRLYVRLLVKDTSGVIGKLGTCFGNHNVSLESIVQIGVQNGLVELVVVTHEVTEGSFQKALTEIRQFPEVTDIPSLFHVL
jgi:homoserine dehydrogenase